MAIMKFSAKKGAGSKEASSPEAVETTTQSSPEVITKEAVSSEKDVSPEEAEDKVTELPNLNKDEDDKDKDDYYDDDRDADDDHRYDDDDHYDTDLQLIDSEEALADSNCGYSDAVHETIMIAGSRVHAVVGDPSEGVERELLKIGDWFQEASHVIRDLMSGKSDLKQETLDAVGSIMDKPEDEEDQEKEEGGETDYETDHKDGDDQQDQDRKDDKDELDDEDQKKGDSN